jgi:flagellar motor switch/type III secretory pathway protein FliN
VPGAFLDDAELSAIRTAIGQASAAQDRPESVEAKLAVPVALIADDRAGERARPETLKIGERWVALAQNRMARALRLKLELEVSGAELIQGSVLRDELALAWTRMLDLGGRPGSVLVAVSGALIEAVSAFLLGDTNPPASAAAARAPSAASIGVFSRAGEVLLGALAEAWLEEQGVQVEPSRDAARCDALVREVLKSDALLALTLELKGPAAGRARLLGRPETFVAPSSPAKLPTVSPETIDRALGDVPVEVRVELGRARMKMSQLARLQPGSLITLQQATDALLPIRCAGVVKAFGRPVISRGAMAVEIAQPTREENR